MSYVAHMVARKLYEGCSELIRYGDGTLIRTIISSATTRKDDVCLEQGFPEPNEVKAIAIIHAKFVLKQKRHALNCSLSILVSPR